MNLAMARAAIEALIFASQEPVSVRTMAEALELGEHTVQQIVLDLADEYHAAHRGIQIVESAGGYVFLTHPECADFVEKLHKVPRSVPMSQAGLETLAIIAYRQPITRAEIEYLRGVRGDSALMTLLDRGLIEEVGRREAPGRPILYGTTRTFLRYFGLNDVRDLPTPDEWGSLPRQSEELREDAEADQADQDEA